MAKYLDQDGLLYFWQQMKTKFSGKVDKETGKGLSTNDYTTAEKNKLSNIDSGAEVNVIEGVNVNGTAAPITNKIAAVTVPTKTSDITNDSGFITKDDVPDVITPSDTTPKMDGTAAKGTETSYARGDHVHPSDTSKLGTSGNGSNVTVAFTQATSRSNITTGISLATAFSRISKWLADLGSLAFKSTVAKTDLAKAVQDSLDLADSAIQTETDPTVPAWAKAATKPTYTASEVGALPSTTKIPSKTSDLTNDSDYITSTTVESTYAKKTDITNMYRHKGSVASVSDLPSTGNTAGDVYNVTATGMNYVWTSDGAWDALGEIFTIVSITNAEIDTIIAS